MKGEIDSFKKLGNHYNFCTKILFFKGGVLGIAVGGGGRNGVQGKSLCYLDGIVAAPCRANSPTIIRGEIQLVLFLCSL
ncbi:hypothetical protein [Ekhidna sp.]